MTLTANQKKWLLKLWESHTYEAGKMVSVVADKPPTVVMRALAKMGLTQDIMGTFWKITEAGIEKAKTIY